MNYLSKVYAFILFVRIINVFITFCSVIVAAVICSDISVINREILLAAVCAALVTAAGNVINDIWDYEADLINKPERPIPSGIITKKTALNFYFSLILVSVLTAMSYNLIILSIIILSHLLLLL
jgi:geranylgeranylglycerol-phosphate geranylgeranyltransferase